MGSFMTHVDLLLKAWVDFPITLYAIQRQLILVSFSFFFVVNIC